MTVKKVKRDGKEKVLDKQKRTQKDEQINT